MSVEKWVRTVFDTRLPVDIFAYPPKKIHRTITFYDRDQVTLTRAEAEGLLRLAGYEKEETDAKD